MLRVGFKTEKGRVREENQDACFVLHSQNVFLLADGVGGGKSGSLASRMTVSEIAKSLRKDPISNYVGIGPIKQYLQSLVDLANQAVRKEAGSDPSKMGMATTLTACAIVGNKAYFIQVGDSRGYILRRGQLIQVTEDHSYVNDLVKKGILTPEEAQYSSERHKITRAVGAEADLEADFYKEDLQAGELVLLCSDGLYGEVSEEEIIEICQEEEDMNEMANRLIERANQYGGHDNISVVCISYGEGEHHG